MKQGKITLAYKTVFDLYRVKGLPFGLSSRLFTLKRKLQPYVEHQQEQEMELLESWKALNPDGTMNITTENVNQVNAGMSEIQTAEVEWNEPPVKITLNADLTEKLDITGEIIEQVEGFIEFMEEGEE